MKKHSQDCSHCLVHGRRYFTDIEEVFPEECERVIGDFKKVFEHEAATREQAMTPEERLAHHQKHSGPILNALKVWLEAQFEQRLVEPNSSPGKAFNYLLNHWPKLTRFLTVSGAPLENNVDVSPPCYPASVRMVVAIFEYRWSTK